MREGTERNWIQRCSRCEDRKNVAFLIKSLLSKSFTGKELPPPLLPLLSLRLTKDLIFSVTLLLFPCFAFHLEPNDGREQKKRLLIPFHSQRPLHLMCTSLVYFHHQLSAVNIIEALSAFKKETWKAS